MGGPSRRFFCLFWCETRQRIFGPEISPYPEVVRGREREWAGQRSWQAVGDGTAERRVSRELQRREGPATAKKIDSRCLHSSSFVEFSLVIHASVSPHMHVVLHTPPSALS